MGETAKLLCRRAAWTELARKHTTQMTHQMDATDQLLLICNRQELTPAHQARAQARACAGDIDWPRLLATATAHGVVPLVYTHMARFSKDWQVPAAALAEGKAHASRNALDKKQRSDHRPMPSPTLPRWACAPC